MNWLYYILISATAFGLLSAYVARKKNREEFRWFWWGFFLGLIGLIIILTKDKLSPETNDYR